MWFTQNRSPLPPSSVFSAWMEGKLLHLGALSGLSQMSFKVWLLSPACHENGARSWDDTVWPISDAGGSSATQVDELVSPYTIMSSRMRTVMFITVSRGHGTVSGTKRSCEQTNKQRNKWLNDAEATWNSTENNLVGLKTGCHFGYGTWGEFLCFSGPNLSHLKWEAVSSPFSAAK